MIVSPQNEELHTLVSSCAWSAVKQICPGRYNTLRTRLDLKWRRVTNSHVKALTLELEEIRREAQPDAASHEPIISDYITWAIENTCISCAVTHEKFRDKYPFPRGEHQV